MLADGKVSNLIDSKEIMKEVSLKDLKSSLSESDNIIEALGINNTQETLGFTDSQVNVSYTKLTESCDLVGKVSVTQPMDCGFDHVST